MSQKRAGEETDLSDQALTSDEELGRRITAFLHERAAQIEPGPDFQQKVLRNLAASQRRARRRQLLVRAAATVLLLALLAFLLYCLLSGTLIP